MLHLDLFSGIGGFAYAADQIWDNVEHIFCDNEEFAKLVLKKHWPESEVYDDIKTFTDTESWRQRFGESKRPAQQEAQARRGDRIHLLTGGFPCQPFSAAGVRRGTSDERYLWPEMLRVIQLTQPTWVIAENVRGLLTWEQGLVLEQVCLDLEAAGYEVQPFIIPASAVNAPHRRDRLWFVAHSSNSGQGRTEQGSPREQTAVPQRDRQENDTSWQFERTDSNRRFDPHDWEEDWAEVATRLCRVDDGLPKRMDRLKAYGNAIVPQVAIEIMRAIKESSDV